MFPIKSLDKISTREQTRELAKEPTKHKKSKLKLRQEFMNEIIANEKDITGEKFWNYFKYQNSSFLAKDLIKVTQAKTEQLVNNINDGLIDLRNAFNRKEIPANKNPNKILDIVEKILDFNKQQKGKGIKILTPKQMLQRLLTALAQGKAGNTYENLLNKIRPIIYSLCREKEVNNITI